MIVFTNISADVVGFAILTGASLVVSIAVYFMIREKKDGEIEALLKSDFLKNKGTESAEVTTALRQLETLSRVGNAVANRQVKEQCNSIIQVSKEILERVMKKPEKMPSIRRFLTNHLPTTLNLVEEYVDMENQRTKGSNIHASMKKIEDALELMEQALKKQLDGLFGSAAMDLDVDVDVLKNVLKKDGLIETNSMNAFIEKGE